MSSMPREVDGKKFVGENLAGNFCLHAILAELSKSVIPSYREILIKTLSLQHFSKNPIGYQEK